MKLEIDFDISQELRDKGYSVVPAGSFHLDEEMTIAWQEFAATWENLGDDLYLPSPDQAYWNGLKVGVDVPIEPYVWRKKRDDKFIYSPQTGELTLEAHSAFEQPENYTGYKKGIMKQRINEAMESSASSSPFLKELIKADFEHFPASPVPGEKWRVTVVQTRVVALAGKPGNPSPEFIHRDGYRFVSAHFINKKNVIGGESIIYSDEEGKNNVGSVVLDSPLESYYVDDQKVWHYATPVLVDNPELGEGTRDIVFFDFEPV